jgi:hypothetical protein
MRDDIFTLLAPVLALGHTTNANLSGSTVQSEIIDLAGEVGGVFLTSLTGITAGDVTMALFAGDEADMSDAAEVTNEDLLQYDAMTVDAAGVHKIAYYGIKRYLRLELTGSGDLAGAAAYSMYAAKPQDVGALG